MSDHDKLLEKSSDCTNRTLQDPKTAVKMYRAVLIRLLHN